MARSRSSLQQQLIRIASDRWARRGVRWLIRAAWLGLAIWCIGIGLHLLLGWPLRYDWLGILSLACLAVVAFLLLRPRMRPDEVARRLDRRFHLNEQLATALEVSRNGEIDGVAGHLHDQSLRTSHRIRRYISARQRFPWAEFLALLALAIVLAGLLAMVGLNPPGNWPTAQSLPQPVPPAEPPEPFPPEPFADQPAASQPGSGDAQAPTAGESGANGDSAAMSTLADALRDTSVTRPAADALDSGDASGAAQSLRELADQAGRISPETRSNLAQDLREAADNLEQSNPELAEDLRNNADGLEGDSQSAAESFDELASAVENLGQPGQQAQAEDNAGQDAGAGQQGAGGSTPSDLPGDQREQARSADRIDVDGVPLELENEGAPNVSAPGEAESAAGSSGGTRRFEQGDSAPNRDRVDAGEDPLRIPADLRDVVQEYFSP
jgi:hypothetical protein